MLIEVRNAYGDANPEVRRYVELRLESVLGPSLPRFQHLIVSVVEWRGSSGARARCRIVGRLKAAGGALAEHTHREMFEAIDGAVSSLAAHVSGSPSPGTGGRVWAA
jgi:hypothetical protein